MAKKKPAKAKKPAISEEKRNLLAQRGKTVQAFPATPEAPTPTAPAGFAERVIERARAEEVTRPVPKPKPKRKEDFQLTVRISDALATQLRDMAYTTRGSQAEIVKRAVETELSIMLDRLKESGQKVIPDPNPPKNTRA